MTSPFENLGNLDLQASTKTQDPEAKSAAIPGMLPPSSGGVDFSKYRVRYQKIDVDDLGALVELEKIETRALRNEGVWVLSKERFLFMEKIFVLIQYIELEND